mgnify:CR=1 FL=1
MEPGEACFFIQLFDATKETGEMRPIQNLSWSYKHIPWRGFKMETVHTILQERKWASSISLADSYFNVAIDRTPRLYCALW